MDIILKSPCISETGAALEGTTVSSFLSQESSTGSQKPHHSIFASFGDTP